MVSSAANPAPHATPRSRQSARHWVPRSGTSRASGTRSLLVSSMRPDTEQRQHSEVAQRVELQGGRQRACRPRRPECRDSDRPPRNLGGQTAAVDEGEERERDDARADQDGRGHEVRVPGGDEGALLDDEQRRTHDEYDQPAVPADERGRRCVVGRHEDRLPAVGRGRAGPRPSVPSEDPPICLPKGVPVVAGRALLDLEGPARQGGAAHGARRGAETKLPMAIPITRWMTAWASATARLDA